MNARAVLALILRALALWTASTFPPSLVWPTILAVALWPLHLQFATRFMAGPLVFAAFVFTMLVALVLFTPISLAVYTIAQQSDLLIDWLKRALC
jgi:predicted PurR-regulated permease PerM